jgi:hypothetical protein
VQGAAPAAPLDFEASLPVASKQLLDATLSTLCSTPGGVDAWDGLPGVAAALPALMAHHSVRVCWRAAKAAAAIAQVGVTGFGLGSRV